MLLSAIPPEYLLFGSAGIVSLIAFLGLVTTPAMGAFGRGWEKVTAAFLSLFVLGALVALGVGAGAAIVYFWDDLRSMI
ncbi:MAG: hypothetical protein ACR2NA_08520 [Solirubrobacterales bacterium]